jgi:cytochrome P450
MPSYFFIAVSLAAAFLIWQISCLWSNFIQARRIGLTVLISPVDPMSPVWLLSQRFILPIAERLPFGLGSWTKYSKFGFGFTNKYHLHSGPVPAFTIASPGKNIVMVADAAAVDNITSRRKDFEKSAEMYKPLEIFGPNVDTVEGQVWQRHRRITTPPFNERNSGLVWKESLRQATDMLISWTQKSTLGVTSLVDDTMILALHVLTAAGFGKSYPFSDGLQVPSDGHKMTYRDALRLILANIFTTILASTVSIPDWLAPKNVKEVKVAIKDFKSYMQEMVEEERVSIGHRGAESDNLMSVLIRASEASKEGEESRSGLTDEEIYGNLFIYNLAGHETTANTLAYAIALLSTDKKRQEWLSEELDAVFGSEDAVKDWDYKKAFPCLKRAMSVMLETLRLYGPVFFIPKYTNNASQRLAIRGEEYTIPPRTYVYIDSMSLHTTPEYWGSDSLEWKPERWITSKDGKETVMEPKTGTFVPWSSGPRVCPGQKFSQVEFTAVLACLFKKHRVRPVLEAGETAAEASQRIFRVVEDSKLEVTLRMNHPELIKLRWEMVAYGC